MYFNCGYRWNDTTLKCFITADAIRRWGLRCTTLRLPQKQIICTTVQIWHTAPLLYSVCYRLINFTDYGNENKILHKRGDKQKICCT